MDDLYYIWKLHLQRKINPEQKNSLALRPDNIKTKEFSRLYIISNSELIRKNLGHGFKPS